MNCLACLRNFCSWQRYPLIKPLFILLALLAVNGRVYAGIEFLSIADQAVIMYNAPSVKAEKLFVAGRHLPVEAVVNVEGWVKVRDSSGRLAWVEKKALSSKRFVIVTVPLANVYRAADENSGLVFQAQERVLLEWIATNNDGWVKVRHPDGPVGFVRISQIWGI